MIVIDDKIISDDIKDEYFLCDVSACKGACCIEGDIGAPVEEKEIREIEQALPSVLPLLSEENRKTIKQKGHVVYDHKEKIYRTPLMKNKACAYAIRENGIIKCTIEMAWQQGKSTFRKPISCHLYPIRITKLDAYDAVNYERWNICHAACSNGKKNKLAVYQFTKEALIRKYGEEFYNALLAAIEFSSSD